MATILKALGLPNLAAASAAPPSAATPSAAPPSAAHPLAAADEYDASRLPPVQGPDGRMIDLNLPKGYNPDAPAKKPAFDKLPSDPKERVDYLADAVTKVQDAAKRDKLVVALRDALVKIQPVMPDKDAKKAIDKAIDSLVETGSKKLLTLLIETLVGKAPTKMPDSDDQRGQRGPLVKEKDIGEHILKSPEIPLPFDKAPKLHRNSFEFRGLPKKARASSYLDFKLRTPDWFEPYGKMGAGRVVVMLADDFKKNRDGAARLSDKRIENKGEVAMSVLLPIDPGSYVIGIGVGSGLESYPTEVIELTK